MLLTISLVIFFVAILLLLPFKIIININIKTDNDFLNINKLKDMPNDFKIKYATIIPIVSKKLFGVKENKVQKKKNKFQELFKDKSTILKLLDNGKVNKFVFSLGFNLDDEIANSYIMASVNTILCLFINYNSNNFDFKKLYYQTYISDNLLVFNFDCIITVSLFNTIKVISKAFFMRLKKDKIYNRRNEYGRTSN